MRLGLANSYARLPASFHARVSPTRVADPQLIVFNRPLARELDLDPGLIERAAADLFSGNALAEDSIPIAMAYAGHQFGVFVPQLGDGRAILLGEIVDRDGVLRDVQLKGAGLTPFSRNGDGRAVLGPMLREYLVSEAMHALGIATTRSLAVVTTGEAVYREGALPGAVLTRVAASHVRVGTFQYFAARGDQDAVRALLDYVIDRHYPQAREAPVPALEVLRGVATRQLTLITQWMLVGFIHGVMNTDNMALSGESIDYGPCAFMDSYHPHTVFSSIDHRGRYAYANQPVIAQWNLARLAETLLPLIDADAERAAALATDVLEPFLTEFDGRFLTGVARKIGIARMADGDVELIQRLFGLMQDAGADFTVTFRRLADAATDPAFEPMFGELFSDSTSIESWLRDWRERLARDLQTAVERVEDMRHVNPAYIPRNHRVEAALSAATQGDFAPFHRLLSVLQHPFDEQPDAAEFAAPPQPAERVLKTYCGT